MSTVHDETTIRLAMIAAGYGDGFALNLPAGRLRDYVTNPDVTRILAALPADPMPDPELTRARIALDVARQGDSNDREHAAALDLIEALEDALTDARAPRLAHVVVYDGDDDFAVTVHNDHDAASAHLLALAVARGYNADDTEQAPDDYLQNDGREANVAAVVIPAR